MTPIWLFLVFLCAPNCSGRYFADRIFRKHSRMQLQDIPSLDAACVDDKNYADKCPEKAAIKDYCKYHSDFMQKNCPKSCGFCSSEIKKPPAPVGKLNQFQVCVCSKYFLFGGDGREGGLFDSKPSIAQLTPTRSC
ncbi:PREDICTED: uncharacterized protein LOC107337757 isoform X3 [Acropora digitifera]|uniref:uncharacterized protein LOC107337757 isoform X3 n=1 Tax=Acropora digitifera TaxID=70779 RepID=UPI00077ADEDA|nr:PREDICTED: uncharacterized protein LOC107337757 isoform X3 [Acropora digitifera]